jgi:hypothetical protein
MGKGRREGRWCWRGLDKQGVYLPVESSSVVIPLVVETEKPQGDPKESGVKAKACFRQFSCA